MASRVTQAPVRALVVPDTPVARVTQAPVRVFARPDADALLTQVAVRAFVIEGGAPTETAELYFKTGEDDTDWFKLAPI